MVNRFCWYGQNTYTLNIIQHIRDTCFHDSSINPVHVRTADRKNMSEGKTNHRRITVTQNVIYQEIENYARHGIQTLYRISSFK